MENFFDKALNGGLDKDLTLVSEEAKSQYKIFLYFMNLIDEQNFTEEQKSFLTQLLDAHTNYYSAELDYRLSLGFKYGLSLTSFFIENTKNINEKELLNKICVCIKDKCL